PFTYTGRTADGKRRPRPLPVSRARSMDAERGDRDQEVERSAEGVQTAHVRADEGVRLLVGQVRSGQRGPGIGPEAGPERGVLLEAVEDDVQVVTAHLNVGGSGAAPPPRPPTTSCLPFITLPSRVGWS